MLGLVDVLTQADGAPRIAHGVLSLSHDADWVAVATAPSGRVAVDLCAREKREQVARVLGRLGVYGDPCMAWAALECALKLRRRGVTTLLDDERVFVEPHGAGAVVRGIGDDVHVAWRSGDGYALAWAREAGMSAVERGAFA
jgi:hypothetical protein